jgi:hypothetical protein
MSLFQRPARPLASGELAHQTTGMGRVHGRQLAQDTLEYGLLIVNGQQLLALAHFPCRAVGTLPASPRASEIQEMGC